MVKRRRTLPTCVLALLLATAGPIAVLAAQQQGSPDALQHLSYRGLDGQPVTVFRVVDAHLGIATLSALGQSRSFSAGGSGAVEEARWIARLLDVATLQPIDAATVAFAGATRSMTFAPPSSAELRTMLQDPGYAVEFGATIPAALLTSLLDSGQIRTDVVDSDGKTLLMAASERRDAPVVELLLKRGASATVHDSNGRGAVYWLARGTDGDPLPVLKLLLSAGADLEAPDSLGITPLIEASKQPRSSTKAATVEALLRLGASVAARDRDGMTPLMYAARTGSPRAASALIAAGASVSSVSANGRTALHWDAEGNEGDPAAVERLLVDAEADVNARDARGETPLMLAARSGAAALVPLLVRNGADLNAKNKDGYTALFIASVSGAGAPAIQALVEEGVGVDERGPGGETPLIAAAAAGRSSLDPNTPDVIRMLLKLGADVNAQDDAGVSALMAASTELNSTIQLYDQGLLADNDPAYTVPTTVVDLLEKAGANRALRDRSGKTAADYAAIQPPGSSDSESGGR